MTVNDANTAKPPHWETVLGWYRWGDRGEWLLVRWDAERQEWSDDMGGEIGFNPTVTHWMPLPPEPDWRGWRSDKG